MQYKKYRNMREWRNGRRACLRGKFERVWVQVPSLAPSKTKRKSYVAFLFVYKEIDLAVHIFDFKNIWFCLKQIDL